MRLYLEPDKIADDLKGMRVFGGRGVVAGFVGRGNKIHGSM